VLPIVGKIEENVSVLVVDLDIIPDPHAVLGNDPMVTCHIAAIEVTAAAFSPARPDADLFAVNHD
jgi:hypothetical protein